MLKFVDGADVRVRNLAVVIYGSPNVGKTSLALTASKPALLDFDAGAHRAGNKAGKAVLQIGSWADIAGMTADDLADYDTVVVDTIGKCLDILAAEIIRNDPKAGRAGNLNPNGYGILKGRFKSWLNALRAFGKDVVLVAHSTEENRGGDEIVYRIQAVGSSKLEVYQQADLMGRLGIDANKQRVISFDPTSEAYGKNVGLKDYTIKQDDPTALSTIIKAAKDRLNESSKHRVEEEKRVAAMRKSMASCAAKGAEECNVVIEELISSNAPPVDRKVLVEEAAKAGVEFDRATKRFVVPKPPPPAPPEQEQQDDEMEPPF